MIPSAKDLVREVLRTNPNTDVNALHEKTYQLMIDYRSRYYERKVDSFLSKLDLEPELGDKLKKKMLEPVIVDGKEYSNFMEEASRRVSQNFQPVSGKIAELCAERELRSAGLIENVHYALRKERTDITVYHPAIRNAKRRHRIEVKNVSLRERATRGLSFDGDSLFGFFNDPSEFSESNSKVLEDLCRKTSGYCYLPPSTLKDISYKSNRFKPNTELGRDTAFFVENGRLP
jgi:hypothetical protein